MTIKLIHIVFVGIEYNNPISNKTDDMDAKKKNTTNCPIG